MKHRLFNLYELTRWIYLDKYINIFNPNAEIISNTELENDLYYAQIQVLSSENISENTSLLSTEIDAQRYSRQNASKHQLEKEVGLTFESFKKRFDRHIKALLYAIFETNALKLFKDKDTYQFTISDYNFFSTLYDSYDKQGKHLIRQEYEKLDPSYVEFLLFSIEKISDEHHFDIDFTSIKEKLNIILLKAYKNQLKDDLQQLENLIQQITNITEDDCIEEKINFIQSNHSHIMDYYQELFKASRKYLD